MITNPDYPDFYYDDKRYWVCTDRDFTAFKLNKIEILNKSLEKWKFILWLLENKYPVNTDGGGDTCACCQYFINNWCEDCPILKLDDQNEGCYHTPYYKFSHAKNPRWKKYWAKKEIEFLEKVKEAQQEKG